MSKEIRDRYDDARSAWADWRSRALEDLKFSNPSKPEQWAPEVITARGKSRPALVFDQTNQYIGQVVNDARQNRPSIDVLPGDSKASDKAAEFYGGRIRQIEYASRAQIAYDTAIEYAARIGMGFLLVVPELVNGKLNDHDIRIKSVVDPLAVTFDPDSIEPDGQDADCGWIDTTMGEDAFRRRWPKGRMSDVKGDGWFNGSGVKVCQYFERTYSKKNHIVTQTGREFSEDDYHAENQRLGFTQPVHSNYLSTVPNVIWQWLSGEEVLEETVYPAPYIGIVPVYGNVLWIDGKRHVCGMTRRMMDGQRAYNYERSAYIEMVALSPKAPWIAPDKAIGKYQTAWENSNRENRAVLPYVYKDENGEVIPPPHRQDPPQVGSAFMQNAQMALSDIQASVGMYKANLGQNSNAKSGVAINKLQTEGDTATFHYIDNLSRSIEQVGRICVAMIPTYDDRPKVARTLGIDGKPGSAQINPKLQEAHQESQDGSPMQVNPAIGAYDVRVKTGPSYTSLRQEMGDKLVQIGQSNPPLAAALAPLVLQMADMPGAEKAIKVAVAMLPPPVQQVYNEDEGQPQIPPQVQQQMQGMQQHIAQLTQALQQSGTQVQAIGQQLKEAKAAETQKFNELLVDAYQAETGRIAALGKALGLDPGVAIQLIQQVMQQALGTPSPAAMLQGDPNMMAPPSGMPPGLPPDAMPQPTPQPPQGGFSLGAHPAPSITPPAMAATGANPGLGEPPQGM